MFGGGRMVWAVCRLTGAGHLSLIAAFPLSLTFLPFVSDFSKLTSAVHSILNMIDYVGQKGWPISFAFCFPKLGYYNRADLLCE